MKLYYCTRCSVVAAFSLFDIRKHGLELPENRSCPVCGQEQAYVPAESI
jgi:hypothetical protein